MSVRRTYSNWSDIVQGSGEVKSLFFALLVIIVVLVLGEFSFIQMVFPVCVGTHSLASSLPHQPHGELVPHIPHRAVVPPTPEPS